MCIVVNVHVHILPVPVPYLLLCMFLGLLDPDPDSLVRGTGPDPISSIVKQKNSKKNLEFYGTGSVL
jgi:hypothetical protein